MRLRDESHRPERNSDALCELLSSHTQCNTRRVQPNRVGTKKGWNQEGCVVERISPASQPASQPFNSPRAPAGCAALERRLTCGLSSSARSNHGPGADGLRSKSQSWGARGDATCQAGTGHVSGTDVGRSQAHLGCAWVRPWSGQARGRERVTGWVLQDSRPVTASRPDAVEGRCTAGGV